MSQAESAPLQAEAEERRQRLLALCDDVVTRASERGATAAEVFAEHVRETSVSLEQNDIKGGEVDEHDGVGIRVFIGDRVGFAYVNRLDERALDEALDDALAIAKSTPGDEANGLLAPREVVPVGGLWDDTIATLPPDEAVRLASELLSGALAVDPRVRIDSGSLSSNVSHVAIATSTGVRAAASETAGVYGLFGMAVDGDEVGSFDHIYEGHRALASLTPRALGERFGHKVVDLLGPVRGKSYKGKVLFSPEAFEEVFVSALVNATDGDEVHKGRSRLKDKLGKAVASSSLTLVDDGTLPGRVASSAFDREGMPHQRLPIVERGVLQAFLYDGKAARRANASSTGHANGDARSLPGIGTTNLSVAAGDASEEDLLRALGDGLFVGRFSGNVDSVSGDFSGVAKGSFVVSGGERGKPVQETLIAGNAFDLLEKIVGVGATVHRVFTFEGPWVLVDGVDVTAGS